MSLRPGARTVVLVLAALAASVGVHTLVADPLADAVRLLQLALEPGPGTSGAGLSQVVEVGAAVALTGCWLWMAAGALSVLVRCLLGGCRDAQACLARGLGPRWVRSLTLAALGLVVTQGPCVAAPPPVGPPDVTDLQGLPLPDRPVARVAAVTDAPHRAMRSLTVRGGDSLWSIAAGLLPPAAPDAVVDRAWRRIATVNAEVLGPDLDLIFPGTTLRVPSQQQVLGKELP